MPTLQPPLSIGYGQKLTLCNQHIQWTRWFTCWCLETLMVVVSGVSGYVSWEYLWYYELVQRHWMLGWVKNVTLVWKSWDATDRIVMRSSHKGLWMRNRVYYSCSPHVEESRVGKTIDFNFLQFPRTVLMR